MNASSGSGLWPKRSTWVASTKPPMRELEEKLPGAPFAAQAGEHVRVRAAREGPRRLAEGKESRVGRVVAGFESSALHHRAIAEENDAGSRAMEPSEDSRELHREPRLFARLAHGGFPGSFSDLEESARQRPSTLHRRVAAAHEQDASGLQHGDAHGGHGPDGQVLAAGSAAR